jgi:ribulose-phosphate 3-epimerase
MIIFAPSILAADFGCLGKQIEETGRAGAQYVHIDVMDGGFVPQISFGEPLIRSIRKKSDLFFDVHLMIMDPEKHVQAFADAGADLITFHLEAAKDPGAVIAAIRQAGKKAGLSIKPSTAVSAVLPFIDRIDQLLVMTVEPGFGGQKYIEASTQRIAEARKIISERHLPIDIEIDGGITKDNVDTVLDAGANVIVAGSAVYRDDPYGNTRYFMEHFAEYEKTHSC